MTPTPHWSEQNTPGAGWYLAALLIPIAGIVGAIMWARQGQTASAIALLATSLIGTIIAIGVLIA